MSMVPSPAHVAMSHRSHDLFCLMNALSDNHRTSQLEIILNFKKINLKVIWYDIVNLISQSTTQFIQLKLKAMFVSRNSLFEKPLSKLSYVCFPLGKLVNEKHFPVNGNTFRSTENTFQSKKNLV